MARRSTEKYTPEQIQELAKCNSDYIYCIKNYMKIFSIEHRDMIPFKLFQYQEKFIKYMQENRLVISMQSRQMGKTETSCAFLLCEAIFNKNQCILITSYDLASAVELIDRVRTLYDSMPDWLKPKVTVNNRGSLKFSNNSRIVARACTKKAGRGLSITRVVLDELALVDSNKANEFWESIVPVISCGGSLMCMSTPKGDSGLFYEIWRDSYILNKGDFKPLFVHWSEHPSRGEQWKKEMIAALNGDIDMWNQEFECSFLSGSSSLIDLPILDNLKTLTRPKLDHVPKQLSHPNWEMYLPVKPNVDYFISVDSSEGGGNDYSVINIFDENLEQVAIYVDNYTDEVELSRLIYESSQYYNEAMIFIEAESTGKAICLELERRYEIPDLLARIKPSAKPGFKMTQSRRNIGISACRQHIKNGKIKLNSHRVLDEFRFFKRRPNSSKYEAEHGTNDDCVMSIVLLCSELEKLANMNENVDKALYQMDESDRDYIYHEEDEYEPTPMASSFETEENSDFDWV